MTRDTFAQAIGQSVKGGGFNLLVGSIAMFGLAETGGGEIRYTELAKTILFGEEDQKAKAYEQAVRHITLFAEVYDKYGTAFTEDQLRLFLKDKAVVEISEANSLAQTVGKQLKNHLKYLTPRSGGEKKPMSEAQPQAGMAAEVSVSQDQLITSFGTIKLVNEATIKLARQLLDVVESQLRESPKSQKTESKKEPTK